MTKWSAPVWIALLGAVAQSAPEGQATPSALFAKYQACLRDGKWDQLFECFRPDAQQKLLEAMVQMAICMIPHPADGNALEPVLEKHGVVVGVASGKGAREPLEVQLARVKDKRALFATAVAYLDERNCEMVDGEGNARPWSEVLRAGASCKLLSAAENGSKASLRLQVTVDGESTTAELLCERHADVWVLLGQPAQVARRVERTERPSGPPQDPDQMVDRFLAHRLDGDALTRHRDRDRIVRAVSKALLDDTRSDSLDKSRLLQMLESLEADDAIQAALDAKSVASRRSAAKFLLGAADGEVGARCLAIVLEWLGDPSAPDRAQAAKLVGRQAVREAAPLLAETLAAAPAAGEDPAFREEAVKAYARVDFAAGVKKALTIAADPRAAEGARAGAFNVLQLVMQPEAEQLVPVALGLAKDRSTSEKLRCEAIEFVAARAQYTQPGEPILGGREFAEVVGREDTVEVQERALKGLAYIFYRDEIVKLLTDPRVSGNRHHEIRALVATRLARIGGTDAAARHVLCDYLVDEAQDVRTEAWLALFLLTGKAHGIGNPEALKWREGRDDGPLRYALEGGQGAVALHNLILDPEALKRAREAFLKDIEDARKR